MPGSIAYDRTKTVIRRHVAPRVAVPLHPEAVAFADHHGFVIDVLAAYRPMGKGRVERQVAIARDHVLAGRVLDSIAPMDAAFGAWLPIRRAQVHRTHEQVISARAEADRAALLALPAQPHLVADRHLRRVGKDTMISFEASVYSLPAKRVRAGQRVQVAVHRDTTSGDTLVIHALATDGGGWLATHPQAAMKGSWVVDPDHWAGLPDGHTRAVTTADSDPLIRADRAAVVVQPEPLASLLHRSGADVMAATRPLSIYQDIENLERGDAVVEGVIFTR